MTDRLDDAKALIRKSEEQLKQLEEKYRASLSTKEISQGLKIDIKNILENLRSALDYSASYIYQTFCTPSGSPKIYFPIAPINFNPNDFLSLANKKIPGLSRARPDIVKLLASLQEFSSKQNDWLPELATLCNENKHEQLTPQEREETKTLTMKSSSAQMTMSEIAKIPASTKNCRIAVFGNVVQQEISVSNPPSGFKNVESRVTVWVSFKFQATGKDVLQFLAACIAGTGKIVNEIRQIKV